METGKVIIIPNENEILCDVFEKEINGYHVDAFIEFSNKYDLGYNFTKKDSVTAPDVLAKNGNLIIKTIDDMNMCVVYLPKVITDKQDIWLHNNIEFLKGYNTVGTFNYKDDEVEHLMSVTSLIKKADEKNMKEAKLC